MRIKIFVLFLLFAFVSVYASAAIVNGSVGNKAQKKYSLKPGVAGWANILLTNSVAATDLDLYVSFIDSTGQEQIICASTSGVRQIEKATVGVDSSSQFYVYVNSFSGSSAFRLAVTVEGDLPGSARPSQMEFREVPMDSQSQRLIERVQSHQHILKQ